MVRQVQVTPNGHRAHWMHNAILMPAVTGISVLVLVLILWCVFAYRRGRNQTPSRTAHHTVIEIIWTLVPVIRSEEHTSELQSLMRISYAVFCLKKKKKNNYKTKIYTARLQKQTQYVTNQHQ